MKNGTILIIDKDRFYRELYHDLLSGVGYDVHVYDSDDPATVDLSMIDLIIVEPNRYDGELGGIFEQVKKLSEKPEVLIITSVSISSVKSLLTGNGIHSTYIRKPFDDSKFLHLVTNIIAQRKLFMEKEKLAKEGMEYLILLEVYKRSSDILSQSSLDNVFKKMMDAVIVELKLTKAMLWFRKDDNTFELLHSFGYESDAYDDAVILSWKTFPYREAMRDGYCVITGPDGRKVMYLTVQGQDGQVYALLRLIKKEKAFTVQDIRVARTLATFGGIAVSNAVKLAQKVSDTLKAGNLPAYSYRYFVEYTANEIKRANRIHGMFSIAVVSIENYRDLIETFGKSYMDDIFIRITNLISEVIRDADTLSVSEHASMLNLFLPDTDYFGSIITMRRIKNQLKQTLYVTNGSVTKNVEIIIGSATYPNDGTTAATLLTRAYDMAKRSSTGTIKQITSMESLGFMEFSDNILSIFKDAQQTGDDITNAIFVITRERMLDIVNLLSNDILARPFMRGLVFLGIPAITKDLKLIKEQYKLYNANTKLYLLGKKQQGDYIDISYAPIMIINEDIGNRFFMFNLNEEYAYGFITNESSGKQFSVFHTSDPIIVEELVAVLQEKYFVQRQI